MEQLFGAIPAAMASLGLSDETAEALAFAAWKRVAGELLVKKTAPIELRKTRLLIAVEDKTWQHHLESLAPQMVARLNGALGEGSVKFVEFRIDRRAVVAKQMAEKAAIKVVPSVSKDLENAANAIADEHLREQFIAAAAFYLERQKTDQFEI